MMKVMCPNCAEKAETYCADCKKPFCRFCATLMHHPSTKGEKHSLEEIASYQGVKIITPILLDLMLIAAGAFLMSGPGITAEYFNGNSHCPALSRGRRWLAQKDANVFFYYKASLSKFCDWEDSYWRFFMDAWVRGILTNTDNWFLLLSEFLRAFVFEEFIRLIITPVMAMAYALLAVVCRLVEWKVFKTIYEDLEGEQHRATRVFKRVESVIKRLSFAQGLAITAKKKPPPPTLFRKRPMTDYIELFRYMCDRQTRLFTFYKAQAQTACRFVLQGSVKVAAAIRVLCILLGNQRFQPLVQLFGFGPLASQHTEWLAESHGLDAASIKEGFVSDAYYSEWLAVQAFKQGVKQMPFVGLLGQDFGKSLVGTALAMRPLVERLLIPAALLSIPPLLFYLKIKRQRLEFAARWKKQSCKEIWGEMARVNPCVEWPQVRFSEVPRPPPSGKPAEGPKPKGDMDRAAFAAAYGPQAAGLASPGEAPPGS